MVFLPLRIRVINHSRRRRCDRELAHPRFPDLRTTYARREPRVNALVVGAGAALFFEQRETLYSRAEYPLHQEQRGIRERYSLTCIQWVHRQLATGCKMLQIGTGSDYNERSAIAAINNCAIYSCRDCGNYDENESSTIQSLSRLRKVPVG